MGGIRGRGTLSLPLQSVVPPFPARQRRLQALPRSKRSRWHAQHLRLRFPAAIAELLLSRAEAGGETAFFLIFFNIFSHGILIFFKKPPMYNPVLEPLAAEHGAPWKDGVRWMIGSLSVCLSVPGDPADRPKSLPRGTNPGKPHKAEMGGKKKG